MYIVKSDIMIKLEQYRDTWLAEKMDEVIGFYPREFYPLDNFSSSKVEWNGYLYSSLEEAYQAASFIGSSEELVEKVKHSHSADEAQRIAYANRDKQRKDWNEVKVGIMEELLRLKIEQNPYVKKKTFINRRLLNSRRFSKRFILGMGSK